MIYLTQLIYIHEGEEQTFLEFESIAIPLMKKHNGEMILRVRPNDTCIIEHSVDKPYEIHYMSFHADEDLKNYLNDERRKQFLHLKEQSIKASTLVKGMML